MLFVFVIVLLILAVLCICRKCTALILTGIPTKSITTSNKIVFKAKQYVHIYIFIMMTYYIRKSEKTTPTF